MSVSYKEYIASDAWKERRVGALERSARRDPLRFIRHPRCEFCGTYGTQHKNSRSRLDSSERRFRVEGSNGLHVHHVTYANLGEELGDELIVLCTDSCHYDAHHRRYHAWRDATMKLAGETDAEWRAKRDSYGPYPELPKRVGCHERVHDDPEFRRLIADLAVERTY